MKSNSKFCSYGDIEKMGKHLEVLALGTLCPKISFLAQKLRAVAREQTKIAKENVVTIVKKLISGCYKKQHTRPWVRYF